MRSHAANPFAVPIGGGYFRVYFTSRDDYNRSHIGYVVIDFNSNYAVVEMCEEPVIAPGELGLFDDSGVAMGFYIELEGVPHIYYLGWNLKVTVPWLNSIGLAKMDSSGKFVKISRAPILDRSDEDPFSISYPSILDQGTIKRMWYGSNLRWGATQNEMNHVIKQAISFDGITWTRNNKVAIDLLHPGEYAISKPFVLSENNKYKMWYSYRGCGTITTYRIGYAESDDGETWNRMDHKAGIDVGKSGWDSEMICYPNVFKFRDKWHMLYNGNGYGETGFGLAILEDE
jgi:hypothetical protein